jgi:curli biogenesis system outer membrane secretion channel CsgG
MMNKNAYLLALVLPFAALGCWEDILTIDSTSLHARPVRKKSRVAVLDFAGKGGQAIADVMTMNLFKADFDVVERDRIVELVFEQQIGGEGYKRMSDVEKAKRLGRILNADYIFTGELVEASYPRYSKPHSWLIEEPERQVAYAQARLDVVARAIDAKTGEIVWIGRSNVTCRAGSGKYLGVMDFISKPCAELTRAFGNTGYKGRNEVLIDDEIGDPVFD